MWSLLISNILATAGDVANPSSVPKPSDSSSGLTSILGIIVAIDLILFLFIVFGPDNRFKEYTQFLILVHGSAPVIFNLINRFALTDNIYIYLGILLVILISYYWLCKLPQFIQIITIANCCFLVNIVIKSLVGEQFVVAQGISFVVVCALFIFLGITRFETLYKIHTIFVCYVIIAYLIELFTGIPVLSSGEKDLKTYSIHGLLSVLVFGILVYLLFFK